MILAASNLSTTQFPRQMYPLPALHPLHPRVASFINVLGCIFRQRAVFDWHEKPSWKLGSVSAWGSSQCLSQRIAALALHCWFISPAALVDYWKASQGREGDGRVAVSPHRESCCFFSLLSSHLISEYLISIMSDPSLSSQVISYGDLNS